MIEGPTLNVSAEKPAFIELARRGRPVMPIEMYETIRHRKMTSLLQLTRAASLVAAGEFTSSDVWTLLAARPSAQATRLANRSGKIRARSSAGCVNAAAPH